MTNVFLADNLAALPWIEHGFGTIASGDWPAESERASLKQIHSATLLRAAKAGILGEGDALVTNQVGLFVFVRTADCVPILLADPVNHAVAAVHAGWRGTAANIVAEAIVRMGREFGTEPGHLWAALGPCIQECCYEVSADVAREFGGWVPNLASPSGKVQLDLAGVNRIQMQRVGVRPDRISSIKECTKCNPERLHSFRRDGERAGRMVSAIRVVQIPA